MSKIFAPEGFLVKNNLKADTTVTDTIDVLTDEVEELKTEVNTLKTQVTELINILNRFTAQNPNE